MAPRAPESAANPSGLSEAEAAARLKAHGYNELPSSKRPSVIRILLRIIQEPMLLLLIACGLLYLAMGEMRDGLLLFASAVLVVVITLYQEVKSERALEALRDLSSPRALVIRDGVTRRIPGREVVPGDLIRLAEGDRVPADAVLSWSTRLSVDESLLTGESFPVEKALDSAEARKTYSGTLIVSGQALATVTATGARTELGKIGRSLETAPEMTTALQKEIGRMIRVFGSLGILFSITIALVYGITRGDWPKGLLAGIAAAMSLLPEEFPVVMTVFLAMGAWRISKKNVLTRRVAAIEALGSISALCVDKTGTLTENRMSVRELSTRTEIADLRRNEGNAGMTGALAPDVAAVLRLAALACHENPFDPMEKAILAASDEFHASSPDEAAVRRMRLYPLSSGFLAMSCVWKTEDARELLVAAKGAPETILQLCHSTREEARAVLEQVHAFASSGRRVLGVASASFPENRELPENQHDFEFRFVGLLTLEDPIRSEVPRAIRECHEAGIRVIMLTGDYPETARTIAAQLKLSGKVVSGFELSRTDNLALERLVRETSVFARVTPEQKLRIVTALRATGERVAMTGDGVNDAPSLKWADIGVAMGGRGTDVAREAASIVLLDDSFTSMVAAIRLGRRIYDNIQKAVFFILSVHVPIAGLTMLPVLFKMPLLLFPAHIVFLELIIDPACTLIYEAEEEEPGIMRRNPRPAHSPLITKRYLLRATLEGLIILVLVLSIYVLLLRAGRLETEARAAAFVSLIVSNLGLILISRVRTGSLFGTLRKKNTAFAIVAIGALVLLTFILGVPSVRSAFAFAPVPFEDLGLAVGAGVLAFLLGNFARRRGQEN